MSNQVTDVWFDEAKDFTLADVERLKAFASAHRMPSYLQGGVEYFGPFVVNPDAWRSLLQERVRENWRQFYRSVRILRRIRQEDMRMFKLYSSVWWRNQYRGEPDMPADMREKLRKEMSRRLNRRLP